MDRPEALLARRYVAIGGRGPEDVVADTHGRVLTGVEDGRILRLDGLSDPETVRVETLADTGGRPLGLELLADDALLVCDAERGLLRVDLADGTVRVLADSVAGEPLRFRSNVVALSDGSVYFTVSSRRYPLHWGSPHAVLGSGGGRPTSWNTPQPDGCCASRPTATPPKSCWTGSSSPTGSPPAPMSPSW